MLLDSLRQDLRYSLRTIARNPGFAATVALTLGLGIGATTAIFTVVSGVLLRPLPFPQPERLVSIQQDFGNGPNVFVGSPAVVEWQKHSRTLSQVAAYFDCSVNLLGAQSAEHLDCGSVTQSMLPTLGVRPALGRNFSPDEDRPGGPPAVILSYALWRRRFGGKSSILGKVLALDDRSCVIVGVMPEGFRIPGEFRINQELWLPFQLEEGNAHLKMVWAVGRLRPGVEHRDRSRRTEHAFSGHAARQDDGRAGDSYRMAGADRRASEIHAGDLPGRGWFGFADRVRQRRQPAALAGHRSGKRNGGPARAGRGHRRASCANC